MSVLYQDVHVAEEYARHRGTVDEGFVDRLARMLQPARTLLDLGTGTGDQAAALAARGLDVIAVEPSGPMIHLARERHPGLKVVQGIGEDLPLADASIDAATIMYVLHHVFEPETVLAEAARVVRPDGQIVVVSGKSDCARRRFFDDYFPTLSPDMPGPDEVAWWAAEAGLDVANVTTTVHWLYPNRTIDDDYLQMMQRNMFATLRQLNEVEFDEGLAALRAHRGRPLPAPEVTLTSLRRA